MDEQFDRIDASIKEQGRLFAASLEEQGRVFAGAIKEHDERFDRVDASIERLSHYVLDFRQETSTRFQTIENRLDMMSLTLAGIPALEAKFAPMSKAILDFGSLSSKITRDQWIQKDATTDILARVEKLEDADYTRVLAEVSELKRRIEKLEKPAA
jgi:hypothetical protein